ELPRGREGRDQRPANLFPQWAVDEQAVCHEVGASATIAGQSLLASVRLAGSPADPALALLQYHPLHRVDPPRAVVQARAADQLLAHCLAEHLARFVADLVDRF